MSEARYLTAEQVADMLGVTRQHVYKLLDSGTIPSVDLSLPGAKKRVRRISEAALESWLNGRANDRRRR